MKKLFFSIALVLCAVLAFLLVSRYISQPSNTLIEQIDSFKQVSDVLKECDEQTLITFDVDDTLITSIDVMARGTCYPLLFRILACIRYPEFLFNKEKFEWTASIVLQQAKRYVFDSDVVQIIRQLRKQGCMVVAFTAMETGSYGVIPSLEEWRASMLKKFGIDFSGVFENRIFETLPSYRGNYPRIYQGIICANQQEKGGVLGAFLDYFTLEPSKVISFDDDKDALNSIASSCAKRKINFKGYHYRGAERVVGKCSEQWSTRRALVQLDYIMQHAQWLSDQDAGKIGN